MKGSAVRIRASALLFSRDFLRVAVAEVTDSVAEGSTRGLRRMAARRPLRIASLIVMRRREALRMTGTFTPGTLFTVVAAWTATQLKLSINGANFTTPVTNTNIPTLTAPTFDIGSAAGTSALDGDILWFAAGSGTLANADATTLNTFGNTDPTRGTLPATPTALWTADTTAYQTAAGSQTTTTTYSYDPLARLQQVTRASNDCTAYWYDSDSNRSQIRTATDNGCNSFSTSSAYAYQTGTSTPIDALTSVTPAGGGA